jgi:type I restriction enzyme S subunit
MSKIDNLIKQLCPNGVVYKPLWSVTIWDKKFNSVENKKQSKIINYKYLLAADLFRLQQKQGNVFLLSTGEQTGWTTEELAKDCLKEGEVITIPGGKSRPVIDCIKYYKGKFVTADNRIMTSYDINILNNKFLYYIILSRGEIIDTFYRGSGIKHPDMSKVLDLSIPVPPLPVQEEIVRILDKMVEQQQTIEKLIELRKKQYEYYREELLKPKEGWVTKTLGEIGTNLDSKRKPITGSKREKGDFPYYGASGIVDYVKNYIFDGTYLLISEDGANLLARSTPIAFIITGKNWVNNHAHVIEIKDYNERKFVEIFLNSISLEYYISDGAQPKLNQENLNKIEVSFPSKQDLEKIVPILDKLESSISELTQTLEVCKKRYTHYRDELLRF